MRSNFTDIIETDEEDVSEKIYLEKIFRNLNEKVERTFRQRERLVLKMRYGLTAEKNTPNGRLPRQLGISLLYVSRKKLQLKNCGKYSDDFSNVLFRRCCFLRQHKDKDQRADNKSPG